MSDDKLQSQSDSLNNFEIVPSEILIHLFGFFNRREIRPVSEVCKRFHAVVNGIEKTIPYPPLNYTNLLSHKSYFISAPNGSTITSFIPYVDEVVCGSSTGEIYAFTQDVKTKKSILTSPVINTGNQSAITTLALNAQGIISGSQSGIRIWNKKDGKEKSIVDADVKDPLVLGVQDADLFCVTHSGKGLVWFWNNKIPGYENKKELNLPEQGSLWIIRPLSGRRIVGAASTGNIHIWHFDSPLQTYVHHQMLQGNGETIESLIVTRDNRIVVGLENGKIRVFSQHAQSDFKEQYDFQAHEKSILDFAIFPNGYLVSSGKDNMIYIWDLQNNSPIKINTLGPYHYSSDALAVLSSGGR